MAAATRDSYLLTTPGGSAYDLASYIRVEDGPDFGDGAMRAAYAENPQSDGGRLGYEAIGVRTMAFPLSISSNPSGLSFRESQYKLGARPGAVIDIQPAGASEAVRFDVLTGRWKPDYHLRHNAVGLRQGTLELDVQPFGYLPTMILLGSAASVGGPGTLSLDTTKLIGDVPGYAEVFVAPTTATGFASGMVTDSVYWSLNARPSFQAFWPAGSGIPVASIQFGVATLAGDKYAPASQSIRYHMASQALSQWGYGWRPWVAWVVPAALEPAYRGRFRAYVWAKATPSSARFSLDVQSGTYLDPITNFQGPALASAAPVASTPPNIGTTYSLLDLGEISLPLVASQQIDTEFRLWGNPGTYAGMPPTQSVDVGGLYLQPLGDSAGVLPRGLAQPSWPYTPGASYYQTRLLISAVTGDTVLLTPTSTLASQAPYANAQQYHRGVLPRTGASTLQLDINLAGVSGTAYSAASPIPPPVRSEPHYAQVSVRYRPRFAFTRGI